MCLFTLGSYRAQALRQKHISSSVSQITSQAPEDPKIVSGWITHSKCLQKHFTQGVGRSAIIGTIVFCRWISTAVALEAAVKITVRKDQVQWLPSSGHDTEPLTPTLEGKFYKIPKTSYRANAVAQSVKLPLVLTQVPGCSTSQTPCYCTREKSVVTQTLVPLPPMKEMLAEFQAPGLGLASPSCCSPLGSEPVDCRSLCFPLSL